MSYCSIGEVPFERVSGPTSLDFQNSWAYAEHPKYSGKPSTQPVGSELETLRMRIRLLWKFCNIRESAFATPAHAWSRLRELGDSMEPQWVLFENGDVYGQYTLRVLGASTKQTSPSGNPTDIEIDLELKEWVEDRPLEVVAAEKRKSDAKKKREGSKSQTTGEPNTSALLNALGIAPEQVHPTFDENSLRNAIDDPNVLTVGEKDQYTPMTVITLNEQTAITRPSSGIPIGLPGGGG